ncbi:mechanosensitive ion channel family protein [Blastopirellula sp. J2-11]|uniref:mechanosensitive ion channel family protein n=1 Tax=Blastopirellula sp. J2-11 TaxID=2943192 RepID=UPI0021C87459|nr:mechanosensitive ion channel family protein [Blastopirellula sp. J2-11]UUO07464.1 mechanosensitive ion channel family protein [Blastopirellula sp. J2-11]
MDLYSSAKKIDWAQQAEQFSEYFSSGELLKNGIATLVIVLLLLILRSILVRAVRRSDKLPSDVRRRWLVQIRNGLLFLFLLGMTVVWSSQIQHVTISILAFAVAVVIATKELIQCVSGSIMKAVGRPFKLGDRIEFQHIRGDVIDHNILTTTIMEIGPDQMTQQLTGRAIVVPNNMFLNKVVINETFTQEYVLHCFKIPCSLKDDWRQTEQDLLEAAKIECEPWLAKARQHFDLLAKQQGLTVLSVDPRITFRMPKSSELELVVRVVAPARRKGRVEQSILRRMLDKQWERAKAAEAEKLAAEEAKVAEAAAAAAAATAPALPAPSAIETPAITDNSPAAPPSDTPELSETPALPSMALPPTSDPDPNPGAAGGATLGNTGVTASRNTRFP